MSVKVTFRNKDKLYQGLLRSVPKIDGELRKALGDAGAEMVAKASQFVPVDEGHLKDSLSWQFTRATQANAGIRSPAIVVQGGSDVIGQGDYIRYVEFGTPDTPKQPFFFPAYRLLRRKLRGRLSRAVTKAIKAAGFGKK